MLKNSVLLSLLHAMSFLLISMPFSSDAATTTQQNLAASPSINSAPDFPALPGGGSPFKLAVAVREQGLDEQGQTTTHQFTSSKIESIVNTITDIGEGRNANFSHIKDWGRVDLAASGSLRGLPVTLSVDVHRVAPGLVERDLIFKFDNETQIFKETFKIDDPSRAANSKQEPFQAAPALPDLSTKNVYQQLEDWLSGKYKDSDTVLKKLADAFVAQTAIDPVAGNPNSFMSMLVNNDFMINNRLIMHGNPAGLDLFSISPSYSGFFAKTDVEDSENVNSTEKNTEGSFYLPLQYTHYFSRNDALIFDIPFNYNNTNDASTYSLSFGVAWMHMLLQKNGWSWSLTPQLNSGAVVSIDLGAGTPLFTSGLGSRVVYHTGDWDYGMTNVLDYLKTLPITIGDFKTPYDFYNFAMQNGIDVLHHFNYGIDAGTYYQRFDVVAGRSWYIPGYNVVGVKIAKITPYYSVADRDPAFFDRIALRCGYTFGAHSYQGYTLGLEANF